MQRNLTTCVKISRHALKSECRTISNNLIFSFSGWFRYFIYVKWASYIVALILYCQCNVMDTKLLNLI